MRVYDIAEMEKLENSDSAFAYIVNTQPDHTELDRICAIVEKEVEEEHERCRKLFAEALEIK